VTAETTERSPGIRSHSAYAAISTGNTTGKATAHLMWREHMSMAANVATAESGTRNTATNTAQRGISPMTPAAISRRTSAIQRPAVAKSDAIALPNAASPPPAENEMVESIAP